MSRDSIVDSDWLPATEKVLYWNSNN